jgi:acyl carrier protein phosphodiesterase
MNFLGHLYLSGSDPQLLVGNLMGDFVKGRLVPGRFPAPIHQGIVLHRWIDTAANQSAFFRRSRLRIDPRFGLYRGVLVDLFYDHFLAVDWQRYSPLPLEAFLETSYRQLRDHWNVLPERLQGLLPVIFQDLLPSYREVKGIERALGRMAQRLSRPSPLASGGQELLAHYAPLQEDFHQFLPEMSQAVSLYLAATGPAPQNR